MNDPFFMLTPADSELFEHFFMPLGDFVSILTDGSCMSDPEIVFIVEHLIRAALIGGGTDPTEAGVRARAIVHNQLGSLHRARELAMEIIVNASA